MQQDHGRYDWDSQTIWDCEVRIAKFIRIVFHFRRKSSTNLRYIGLNFRVEFDAYRSDLEFYSSAPQTEVNLAKQRETEEAFTRQKQEFEKLRSDVQIKLKFLDENRVILQIRNRLILIALHKNHNDK